MNHFFLQGLLHPLQYPAHIIMLTGLGLLLGQQGMRHLRWGVLAFLLSIITGLLLSKLAWGNSTALLVSSALAGILLALRLNVPCWLSGLLASISGMLIGLASAPNLLPGLKAIKIYAAMAGTTTSTSLALLLLALLGLILRPLLDGIILRILGSWVVASALMVLTLLFANR